MGNLIFSFALRVGQGMAIEIFGCHKGGNRILPSPKQPKDIGHLCVVIKKFQSPQEWVTKNIKVIEEF
jgi:hypothetical protein